VVRDRDVQMFDNRAPTYERGVRGRLHQEIVSRSAMLALAWSGSPRRVLDVGCGTGLLLRQLATQLPEADELTGVDAAPAMVEQARTCPAAQAASGDAGGAGDPRLTFLNGSAEALPFPADAFDLVVSTTSFDHWADQRSGLTECRRVLAPGGLLVLTDLFSPWLAPTLAGSRRDRARTPLRATKLLAAVGFRSICWHRHYGVIVRSVTASG